MGDFCSAFEEFARLTGSKATACFSFSATRGTVYAGFFPPFRTFGLRGINCFAAAGRDNAAELSDIPPRPKHFPDKKSCLDNWWSISISLLPNVNSTPSVSLCAPSIP